MNFQIKKAEGQGNVKKDLRKTRCEEDSMMKPGEDRLYWQGVVLAIFGF
jgi:hypothetical protein